MSPGPKGTSTAFVGPNEFSCVAQLSQDLVKILVIIKSWGGACGESALCPPVQVSRLGCLAELRGRPLSERVWKPRELGSQFLLMTDQRADGDPTWLLCFELDTRIKDSGRVARQKRMACPGR